MEFRITQQQSMLSAIRQAQSRQAELANLQHQLSTGLKINKPSDAPEEWSHLSSKKTSVNRMAVDLENISTVRHRLNQSVSSLTEAGNILVRARELALGAHQSQDRETLALEIDRLITSMLSVSNSADGGVQLYSGTASHQKPFDVVEVDEHGRPTKVAYLGSTATSETVVGFDSTADVLPSGEKIFQQTSRTASQFIGQTGAKPGIGTDSSKGVGNLVVRHTSTSYASAVVSPGVSSPNGDTVIGPSGSHALRISDHATLGRVVQLNDGGPVPFTPTDTDLKVIGPQGETVFVDLSAVPGAFIGDIDITAQGTMSTDGGLTEVTIDFSASQIVTDSASGGVTVVDSTDIRGAGTDRVEYSGTNGVFEALMQLRDDLRNGDQWSTPEFRLIMDARLSDIERVHSQVLEFVGEQSAELSNLEVLESRTRELQLVTQEAVINIESADAADVIVRLQAEQNYLQFIFATTATMNQTSLLDFMA